MANEKNNFRHESLHDADSIQALIESINKGIASGSLTLSDNDGAMTLEPHGLMNLKVSATKSDGRNRLTFRITWHDQPDAPKKKNHLKIKGGKKG